MFTHPFTTSVCLLSSKLKVTVLTKAANQIKVHQAAKSGWMHCCDNSFRAER